MVISVFLKYPLVIVTMVTRYRVSNSIILVHIRIMFHFGQFINNNFNRLGGGGVLGKITYLWVKDCLYFSNQCYGSEGR